MKISKTSIACICLTMFATASGCDEASSQDIELRASKGQFDCPRWQCGYNTSEINGKSLTEINLDGALNGAGVALVGFTSPLAVAGYELDVEGDALIARSNVGEPTRSGLELVGSLLWLQVDTELTIPVLIAGYEEVQSWAADTPAVAAYSLVYADLDQPSLQRSVCKGTLVDPLQASVVILSGERYEANTKAVIPNQNRWITLGCAGSATAKMALLGYGPNGDLGGQGAPAEVEQRQATLKMITADYCGNGQSYTADGTPLVWENTDGSVAPGSDLGELEAVWTAHGAACLNTPRVVDRSAVTCSVPSCDEYTLADGEWMTHAVSDV